MSQISLYCRSPFLLVATLLVLGQPASVVRAAPGSDGAVVGQVFDSSQGPQVGLHFATVEISIPGASGGHSSTSTASDGSFVLLLPPGDDSLVFLSAKSDGFFPFYQWTSGAQLRQAPVIIGLQPAAERVPVSVSGVVYDVSVGLAAPIEAATIEYTYHSYRDAYPEVSQTLRTQADGRYLVEAWLGPDDWIELRIAARGFADYVIAFALPNLTDGTPLDIGLAPSGGVAQIDPAVVHINCPGTFPVTITNASTDEEALVISALGLHFHYGEGVYGQAFAADFSGLHFPLLLGRGEQVSFPLTFLGGGGFPTLAQLEVLSGARSLSATQFFGGFSACNSACRGDCDGSGGVTIDELVRGVEIALGRHETSECSTLDADQDSQVSVDELVAAVGNALQGCGG